MKILVVGNTHGKVSIINEYLRKSQADICLCVGDVGIFYNTRSFKQLPKSFIANEFPYFLSGIKRFCKPVVAVRGAHDNISLCHRLQDNKFIIPNFTLLKDGSFISVSNITLDKTFPMKEIVIGGVGGSYSFKSYIEDINNNRNFCKQHIDNIKRNNLNILIMHDLINESNRKRIIFSDDDFDLMKKTNPFYCFVGKYNWWGASKIENTNVVLVPEANKGYIVINTFKDWNAEAVRFDLSVIQKGVYND